MVDESAEVNIYRKSLENIPIFLLTLLLLFGAASTVSAEIPSPPASLSSNQGNFWINYTWSAGGVNVTDSYNVSINGSWVNGTLTTFNKSTVSPHGWSNITLYAYNNTGAGNLSSPVNTSETQVSNNDPVQASIGDKTVTAGNALTFTVSATDADSDTRTYGTNATNGTLNTSTGDFNWTTSVSDIGTYVWSFNSTDGFGGEDNETITVTVQAAPVATSTSTTTNGDDSTGNDGVTTFEPSDNIAKAERHDKTIFADKPVTYTFTAPEHGVYNIVVTGEEDETSIALRVEALKGTSTSASASPSGTVYKNLNVWAGTKKIKAALIRFKVENSWISSSNIAAGNVKMVRWDGGKWVQLDTTQKTTDNSYTYYEAKTGGFSSFAIVGLKKVEIVPTEPEPTVILTAVPPPAEETTPVPEATEDKESPGFGAVAFISAMALMVAIRNKRR